MKIFYAPASPFVRKCLVVADEVGLRDRIEIVATNTSPVSRDAAVAAQNPLGKIPTLITDDGATLYDSRVICEYLNGLGNGGVIPRSGEVRFRVLTEQALADGMMDAAVLTRYETFLRPEALRWNDWIAGQLAKVNAGLDALETRAASFDDRVDVGTIAFACALGYLDFRLASLAWRDHRPNAAAWFEWFSGRDSMVATRPPAS